ncbi:entericidin, EcnA/B family [Oceanicola sp. 502str15]|nr:entericidin, EcnA/B family [Oceanicola sp. 502str15]MCO6381330.1 entericidin, EcnA/B family [Oceanicola sp. 502str15]
MTRITLALLVLTLLSACETVKGVGRDVTNTADAVQNAF